MLNMMRAELYRFKNSGNFLYLMIIVSILLQGITFSLDKNFFDLDLSTGLMTMTQITINMVLLACGTLLTVFIGISYNNRMSYYEIMSGNSPFKIIIAKTMTTGIISSVIMFIPTAVMLLISYLRNGKGEVENPAMVFDLLFVITLHTTISFVLYSMLGRNLVFASFVPYIRLGILDMIVFLLCVQEFSSVKDSKLLYITTNSQMANLATRSGDGKFFLLVLLSSIAECAVLYILVYFIYKKKKFR